MSNDMSYENKNSNSTGIKTKSKRKRRRRKHIAAQQNAEELTSDKLPLVFQTERNYEKQSKLHDYERSSTLVLPKLTKFEKFDKEEYKRYAKSDSETDRSSISQTLPPINFGGLATMEVICDNTGRNNVLPSISHRPRGKLKDLSR